MTTPTLVRLQHVPVDWPVVWQIKDASGREYLAGFKTEASALAYMKLKDMRPVGD